jgi:peptide/nickel transport system substrate-binding protein
MRRLQLLTLVIGLSMLAAACGQATTSTPSPTAGANTGKVGGKLVIANETGSTWTCQFNPFNSAVSLASLGFVYEPLAFVDILKTDTNGTNPVTPWLAMVSTWSNGYKTLTFTIRSGAKWSDGTRFTARDVVYTFDAMKTSPTLDLDAIWKADGGPLTTVALQGTDQVVFTFNAPSESYFYYVADQTPIIPEHIWGSLNQRQLASYIDTNPVGTGPYLVSNCSQDNIKYLRNSNYWQSKPGHPVPQIKEVDYPAFLSNTPCNLDLIQGAAQWGGQPIPNIVSSFVNKDPKHRGYWFPPVENVSIFPNLTNPLLSNLAVRKAITLALDRSAVSQRGESGYEPPANQTGIVLPTFKSWYDSSLNTVTYDPSKADQVLQAAGFTKGANGIYQNAQGQQLSFTIKSVSGFADWDASLQVITQDLKAVGIQVTPEDENSGPYVSDLDSGNFQLAYAGGGGPYPIDGPSPYYELRGILFSGNIGSTDYSRYASASTNALFNAYPAASPAQQVRIMHQIEQVMVNDIPVIPVTEGVNWFNYNSLNIGGWPTASNPYAQPAPYQFPDDGVLLTHLYPLS